MITKFNQYKMNEEYGLPIDRTKQQFMIKEIAKNINTNFITLFDAHYIRVTINNTVLRSGKFNNKLDIHKVSDALLDFIQLEKELIENRIIERHLPEIVMDMTHITVSFEIPK